MILVIDNYDSFTYNLVQYLGELGQKYAVAEDLKVYRNDQISLEEVKSLQPDAIVISPGPGRPDDAGISLQLIEKLSASTPILGVCLGHQSIGQVFGGKVVAAPELMHGKTSQIYHQQQGIFAGLASPVQATRYHSLIVERESLPECLEVTAWLADGMVMAFQHRDYPHVQSVQFHPESILTKEGKQMLENFLQSLG
ncbi:MULTISPECIES: aminodeoxychorismate/anthranilate synthase component II [unclassified Synechocystis]|uniref:anthranilate synthase component II n=1 Tax=unclassified Synechocystis TaxID=2640012 RepID=UPI0002176B11|nr:MULTISPECIES: aminodeoxychorismate/anthranilate synthase component II [unclassified Synechocystis]BAM54371.1 anthranilate synthase component II [Synechocystis sp. PCC 6803] [Bacillus subtilis BEST7613]ALJ68495.1 anthranilate synthase [Synechocystis sp. PCC 6803]AVP90340.1 aminodeoxychorismate/anthranilate synthase component II [Synechocystis sp. IPPAS B-1465]MBD2616924.1 aminodeoxychorismate/anthranilate synthase component II [Synechocystis sp. FACHB-898]MBD2638238.1 aminodeoxychorismate/an